MLRNIPTRNRAAAALYAVFGTAAVAGAIVSINILLAAMSIVLFVAAVAALRRYPIDRYW